MSKGSLPLADEMRFLSDLGDVCRRYGIGIGSGSPLFLMESDDLLFDYSINNEGDLILGDSDGNAGSRPRRDA